MATKPKAKDTTDPTEELSRAVAKRREAKKRPTAAKPAEEVRAQTRKRTEKPEVPHKHRELPSHDEVPATRPTYHREEAA